MKGLVFCPQILSFMLKAVVGKHFCWKENEPTACGKGYTDFSNIVNWQIFVHAIILHSF